MAGKPGKSGRKRKSGTAYRFDFYYRVIPGEDPPELEQLLQAIIQARGQKRRDILRSTLLGGVQEGQDTATQTQDSETIAAFDTMFDDF